MPEFASQIGFATLHFGRSTSRKKLEITLFLNTPFKTHLCKTWILLASHKLQKKYLLNHLSHTTLKKSPFYPHLLMFLQYTDKTGLLQSVVGKKGMTLPEVLKSILEFCSTFHLESCSLFWYRLFSLSAIVKAH